MSLHNLSKQKPKLTSEQKFKHKKDQIIKAMTDRLWILSREGIKYELWRKDIKRIEMVMNCKTRKEFENALRDISDS